MGVLTKSLSRYMKEQLLVWACNCAIVRHLAFTFHNNVNEFLCLQMKKAPKIKKKKISCLQDPHETIKKMLNCMISRDILSRAAWDILCLTNEDYQFHHELACKLLWHTSLTDQYRSFKMIQMHAPQQMVKSFHNT